MLLPHVRRAIAPHFQFDLAIQAFEEAYVIGIGGHVALFVQQPLIVVLELIEATVHRASAGEKRPCAHHSHLCHEQTVRALPLSQGGNNITSLLDFKRFV